MTEDGGDLRDHDRGADHVGRSLLASWTLGSILDVEASHLALSKTENMSDRF